MEKARPVRLAWPVAATATLLLGALGCSFSTSATSLSESSESSSASSGSSSGEKSESYREDVSDYTAAWIASGSDDPVSFFSGLGDLARRHGISDWEADLETWESIGRGLARTGADEAVRSSYALAWTGGDPHRQHALELGFDASR